MEIPPDLLYIGPGRLERPCGCMNYERLRIAYAPRRLVSPAEGSRHAQIAVTASSACLWDSTIRDRRMDLVRTLATLRM